MHLSSDCNGELPYKNKGQIGVLLRKSALYDVLNRSIHSIPKDDIFRENLQRRTLRSATVRRRKSAHQTAAY